MRICEAENAGAYGSDIWTRIGEHSGDRLRVCGRRKDVISNECAKTDEESGHEGKGGEGSW